MAERGLVADTSPLMKLVGVDLLDLLPRVYRQVLVPEQVLAAYQTGAQPTDPDLRAVAWVQLHPAPIDPVLLDALDVGEAAAIALAEAHGVRAVLMDDRAGRRMARERGRGGRDGGGPAPRESRTADPGSRSGHGPDDCTRTVYQPGSACPGPCCGG